MTVEDGRSLSLSSQIISGQNKRGIHVVDSVLGREFLRVKNHFYSLGNSFPVPYSCRNL